MKVYIRKELIEESEEVARAIEELKSLFAAQKINRRDVTAARDYYDRGTYLKTRIQELRASLEAYFPNFDPNARERDQHGKWVHAHQHIYSDIEVTKADLSQLEKKYTQPPDLERLMAQAAAVDRRIAELKEKISGYVGIDIAPIPGPETEEILEIERRDEARLRGILEKEGPPRPPGVVGSIAYGRR